MQELQLDLFAAPPTVPSAPTEPLSLRYSVRPKHPWATYAEVIVRQNDDGTWSESNSYAVSMYCGGGQPCWGAMPSFEAALSRSIARLLKTLRYTAFEDQSSCCGAGQKAEARKLVEWLESLAAEYGLTGIPARGQPFPASLLGYSA